MHAAGRFLYIIGIALTIAFAGLLFASVAYFSFIEIQADMWGDLPLFTFAVLVPLTCTLIGVGLITLGERMQHGKNGRTGGIVLMLLGACLIALGSAPVFAGLPASLPNGVSSSGIVSGSFALCSFGLVLVSTGYMLARRRPASFRYPFQKNDDATVR